MRDLFSRLPHIDFLSRRRAALYVSCALLAVSLLSLGVRGLEFGIDFTGGTLIEVGYAEPAELDPIRGALGRAGFGKRRCSTSARCATCWCGSPRARG